MERSRSTADIASLIPIRFMEELLVQPLPSPWSYGVMQDGRVFFVNEEEQTTTWMHPTFNHPVQTGHLHDQALPKGWEVNLASGDIPFYIDHMNRSTTFQYPEGGVQPITRNKEKKSFRFQRSSSKRKSGKQKIIDKMASVKRDVDAPISFRGWLNRQEVSGPLKSWRRRWCVLSDLCLFFYKGSDEGHVLGSLLLPSFKISPCVKDEDGISKRCAFKAEHENVKTTFFYADTDEEMEKWIDAMRTAANAQFHSADEENDFRFRRSHSQNALSSRTQGMQNLSDGARNGESDFEPHPYAKRQHSMPSGIDLAHPDTDESRHDARADGFRTRADGTPYARGDEITGGAGLTKKKSLDMYSPDQAYPDSDKKNVSSNSDDDFMYMNDLNLSHRPVATPNSMVKQPSSPLNQPYGQTGVQNSVNFYADDRQKMLDSNAVSKNNLIHGQYLQQQPRTDRNSSNPAASHMARDPSQVMPPGAELNQKLPVMAQSSSYSSSQNNSRYPPIQDFGGVEGKSLNPSMQTASRGIPRDAVHPSGTNPETQLLDDIRNQKIDRIPGDVSGSQVYAEIRPRLREKSLEHTGPEHKTIADAKGKFSGSFDLRAEGPRDQDAERRLESHSGQPWSAKQLGQLEVEKPLSRVEEWTMEQRRQQQQQQEHRLRQESEARNDERLQNKITPNLRQTDYHDPHVASQHPENHFARGPNLSSSPTRTNRSNVDSIADGAHLPGIKTPGFDSSEKMGQRNSNYGNQNQEMHRLGSQKDRNQPIAAERNQPIVAERNQPIPAERSRVPSQKDLVKPRSYNDSPVHAETGSQLRKMEPKTSSSQAQGFFSDVNQVLSENSRLCRESSAAINQHHLTIDELIGRLIPLRRSQMKLEEGRYALLGHLHLQLTQPMTKETSRVTEKALQEKLIEIEQQTADTNALVAELDRRLTNLRSAELSRLKPNEQTFPASELSSDSEKRLAHSHAPDRQLSPSSIAGKTVDPKTEKVVDKRQEDVYALRKQVEQESNFVNQLREEKSRLEKSLSKATRDEQLERDPSHLSGIRRQKQAIDRELYSLQTKLTFAVKNLENIKNKCFQMEQNAGSIQDHAFDKSSEIITSSANKIFPGSVNTGANDARIKEPGGNGGTYYETDLDTGRCIDLAASMQRSGVEGQTGYDIRQRAEGMQPQQLNQIRNPSGNIYDKNRELSTGSSHSSVLPEREVNASKNATTEINSSVEHGRGAGKGRFYGIERDSPQKAEPVAARRNPPADLKYQVGKNEEGICGNPNAGNFSADARFRSASDYPNWHGQSAPDLNRGNLPTGYPSRLPNEVRGPEGTYRTGHDKSVLGHGISSTGSGNFAPTTPMHGTGSAQYHIGSKPADVASHSAFQEKRNMDGIHQNNIGASLNSEQPSNVYRQSFNYAHTSNTASGGRPETWNPAKPPRQFGENREWQKGTELRSSINDKNLHGRSAQLESSSMHRGDRIAAADGRYKFSSSSEENVDTIARRPRSKSLSRGQDDGGQETYGSTGGHRDALGNKGAESEQGQSSPTGGIGPRDRIRRMSGFFTPKPFKGGGGGGGGGATGSAQVDSKEEGNSSKDLTSLPVQAYNQHIDQIFSAPQKVEIPDRYSDDPDNEALSPEEAQRRKEKAEKYRKMLAVQSLQEFTKGELTTQTGGILYRLQDERRRREQMLDTRQLLAEEVSRRTRQGSDSTPKVRTVEELLKDSDDGQYL